MGKRFTRLTPGSEASGTASASLERPKAAPPNPSGTDSPPPEPWEHAFPWLKARPGGKRRTFRRPARVAPGRVALVLAADEAGMSRRKAAEIAGVAVSTAHTIVKNRRGCLPLEMMQSARETVRNIQLWETLALLAALEAEMKHERHQADDGSNTDG